MKFIESISTADTFRVEKLQRGVGPRGEDQGGTIVGTTSDDLGFIRLMLTCVSADSALSKIAHYFTHLIHTRQHILKFGNRILC